METFMVTRTVETGKGEHGIVIDGAGGSAYVTNLYGNDVAVLDLGELEVSATVRVGDTPNGISISPSAPATPSSLEIKLTLPDGEDMDDGDGDMHP
jgi:YVTN family beta-propeller protein